MHIIDESNKQDKPKWTIWEKEKGISTLLIVLIPFLPIPFSSFLNDKVIQMIKNYSGMAVLVLLLTMTASCMNDTIMVNEKSANIDSASTTDKDVETIGNYFPHVPTYKNVEAIKNLYPSVDNWLVHKFNGREFLFCQSIHLTVGASVFDFHGWFYDSHKNAWQHFITARTRGIGVAEIVFDDNKGICTLRGTANTKFKNVDVVLVNLYLAGAG